MKTRLAIPLLALICAALAPACSMPRFHVGPHVGSFDIDGDVEAKGVAGPVSIKGETDTDEMGFDRELGWTPRIEAEWDDFIVGLSGINVSFSGDGTINGQLQLGDRPPISAGSAIDSDLTIGYLTLDALYKVLDENDPFELGLGLGLGAVMYDLEIQSKVVRAARVAVDDTLPFGYLAARIAKDFGPVDVTVIGHGAGIELEDEGIFYFEFDANAAIELWGSEDSFQGRLQLGYRHLDLGYELDKFRGSLDFDASISGPYLALIFTF